jgi:hypothetical protein
MTASAASGSATAPYIDFCGELYALNPQVPFIIGRDADLVVDNNPYLHRRFLQISHAGGMWWIVNVGSRLAATVSDDKGRLNAWLAPGAKLPLVFERTLVWFTAGPTTYEVEIFLDAPVFAEAEDDLEEDELAGDPSQVDESTHTIGRASFTPDQKLLILALAEAALKRGELSGASVPTSADAAARLGWTLTKFNRKLDNVCQKLARHGVRGLHGGPDRLAGNRRAKLVEFAISARLVTTADLAALDQTRA